METKRLQIQNGLWITVPRNLSPAQEAQLLADLDPEALESECKEVLRQHEAGELLLLEAVLSDVLKESTDTENAD